MSTRTALTAVFISAAILLYGSAAAALTIHPAVSIRGSFVTFYAGHLVLDAQAGAYLDDGIYHVSADRIILDLRNNRYVAAGDVSVCSPVCVRGAAFGADLKAKSALIVAVDPAVNRQLLCEGQPCAGDSVVGPNAGPATKSPAPVVPVGDPLALPDVGNEQPYAVSPSAVAHLGADVRLKDARVIVPGSRALFLPSYVYTFSPDPGYTLSNVPGSGEDVPVYFGSTRTSIQGLHFMYNPTTKLGLGIDDHLVNGQRSYVLLSEAPMFGPNKIVNLTWLEQINSHTTQTFTSSTTESIGTFNAYDLRDSVHRSFVEFTGSQFHQLYGGTFGWQSFDQQVAHSGLGSLLYFHLRSEIGELHNPTLTSFFPFPVDAIMPAYVAHGALEGYAATRPLAIGRNDTLTFSADDRESRDTLPHTQTAQIYSANLSHRWNRFLTTGFSENLQPIHDGYPTVNTGVFTRLVGQSFSAFYSNANSFGLVVNATHNFGYTDAPGGLFLQPWFLTTDVRFRVGRGLALDISRSYNFNYFGRTWGGFGIQILP